MFGIYDLRTNLEGAETVYPLVIGLIFFVASAMATVTGFGAGLVGFPLLTLVVGVVAAKQSMVVLGVVSYAFMTLRQWDEVDFKELKRILLIALPGLVVGMVAYRYMPVRASTMLLGVFVLFVGVKGLLGLAEGWSTPGWMQRVTLFMGGMVHGAFATGGPLVVVYCRQALPERTVFRATLGAMWVLLGAGLMVEWTLAGSWDGHAWQLMGVGLPALVAGVVGGEIIFKRMNAEVFGTVVHLMLLGTGGALIWGGLR